MPNGCQLRAGAAPATPMRQLSGGVGRGITHVDVTEAWIALGEDRLEVSPAPPFIVMTTRNDLAFPPSRGELRRTRHVGARQSLIYELRRQLELPSQAGRVIVLRDQEDGDVACFSIAAARGDVPRECAVRRDRCGGRIPVRLGPPSPVNADVCRYPQVFGVGVMHDAFEMKITSEGGNGGELDHRICRAGKCLAGFATWISFRAAPDFWGIPDLPSERQFCPKQFADVVLRTEMSVAITNKGIIFWLFSYNLPATSCDVSS